ncbi:MAG TPA: hypothetical protein VER03_08410 [Bryobacteraceae bacterium]|nr:hypothetical protein [Bryobacteraceae bacterium]
MRTAVVACGTAAVALAANTAGMQAGKATLKSAGQMAFGPNGVLFVGDSLGASIVALDSGDTAKAKPGGTIEIKALNEKIAAALGTTADQITINDMVVNPTSKRVYVSVTRGRGADAVAVIMRTDASGKLTELSLDNIKHATVAIPNAPAENATDARAASRRLEAITDLAYVDGKVIVAGLSNEEFSSTLRSIPYPFQAVDKGAGIEIYHGAHGRFETNAPVRTFVPYDIAGQKHILAAYTCTPLVRIPVSELKAGAKVKGTTIAELGNRNRPLDMIAYSKDKGQYILMANSSRGVMKLKAEGLEKYEPIVAKTEGQGVPFETIADLKGVQQLDKLDDTHAVLLTDAGGSLDLRTIALP